MYDQDPVWDVYDLLRTSRLNIKYYSYKLSGLERSNFLVELIVAITAPSSSIAGLFFWDSDYGQYIWKILGILAAVFSVVKPLLNLTDKIRKYSETLIGYRVIFNDLQSIMYQIKQKGEFTDLLQKDFNRVLELKKEISINEPEIVEDENLKDRFQNEVLVEFPTENFFIPGE